MKKVLIISSSIAIGGAQKQQFLLKEKLEEDGFDVDYCFVYIQNQSVRVGWSNAKRKAFSQIQFTGYFPYYKFNPEWPIKSIVGFVVRKTRYYFRFRKFRRFIVKGDYDWIIPFSRVTAFMAIHTLTGLKNKTHVFFNQRGGELNFIPREFVRDLQSLGGRTHLLSNAYFSMDLLKETFEIDRGLVLKNFLNQPVDLNYKRLPKADLIHVANYYPEKDFDTLFKALKIVKQQYPPICLHMFCMFRLQAHFLEMKEMIEKYDLSKNIRLYYQNEDKTTILSKATLGVLATNSEGCSNSILEYLSYSLPVITSAIPANSELLGSVYDDYMYEKQNAEDLADKINLLLSDETLRTKLSKAAKEILTSYMEQSEIHYDKFKTYLLSH